MRTTLKKSAMPRRYVIVAVCLALVLVCAGMLFPAVIRVREMAERMKCSAHFSQTAFALHNYASTYGGAFPPGTVPHADLPPDQRLSWWVLILPYREEYKVYKQFDLARGPGDPRNENPANSRFQWIVCPSSGEREYDRDTKTESWKSPTPLTHYVGVAGVGIDAAELPLKHPRVGIFGHDRRTAIPGGIPDGTSNTFLLIETAHNPGHWAYGGTATVRAFESQPPYIGPGQPFGGFHDGPITLFRSRDRICLVAFADGRYRILTDKIDPTVLEALATVGGKEEVPAEW